MAKKNPIAAAAKKMAAAPVSNSVVTEVKAAEVKAETNLKSQSLKCYCEKYHPQTAIRFSAKKYIDQGWMKNVPLYAVCTL